MIFLGSLRAQAPNVFDVIPSFPLAPGLQVSAILRAIDFNDTLFPATLSDR